MKEEKKKNKKVKYYIVGIVFICLIIMSIILNSNVGMGEEKKYKDSYDRHLQDEDKNYQSNEANITNINDMVLSGSTLFIFSIIAFIIGTIIMIKPFLRGSNGI